MWCCAVQVNKLPTSSMTASSQLVRSTSRTHRRGRRVIFVAALTTVCVALVASAVLLTTIVVRRRLQRQQQYDVTDDVDVNADVPRRHVWTSMSTISASDRRRRATRVAAEASSVSSTPSPWLSVFRALQTATWSTDQRPSTSTLSFHGGRRHRRLPAHRRRRPSGRRHRGRPHRRRHDDDDVVEHSSTELRRLARIALRHHLVSSDDKH